VAFHYGRKAISRVSAATRRQNSIQKEGKKRRVDERAPIKWTVSRAAAGACRRNP